MYFQFFNKNKYQSRNSDKTYHFPQTINKIPRLFPDQINSPTFRVSDNPGLIFSTNITYTYAMYIYTVSQKNVHIFIHKTLSTINLF